MKAKEKEIMFLTDNSGMNTCFWLVQYLLPKHHIPMIGYITQFKKVSSIPAGLRATWPRNKL